ncbi:hypothetical protein PX554_20510 [Sphingomonas sp. H39-1-10]|uniref:hypothetical protein n=1 Tax=Sphingomonas pollutisoli TaxID=3030829 RepID=UPI0023B8DA06|nr:hypothetical protein [Sphingomonas pollutisoli]MDF0490517.1 hypothetical protein [Sphingomonas pollutisoli]
MTADLHRFADVTERELIHMMKGRIALRHRGQAPNSKQHADRLLESIRADPAMMSNPT